MGSWNKDLQEMVGVDTVEVFTEDLYEYGPFESHDLDEEGSETWTFYDIGSENLPYTLMSVLEYYFKNKRAVKITVEDAGESFRTQAARAGAEAAAAQRQRALVTLEGESRFRNKQTHHTKLGGSL